MVDYNNYTYYCTLCGKQLKGLWDLCSCQRSLKQSLEEIKEVSESRGEEEEMSEKGSNKLYKVVLRGFERFFSKVKYDTSFVVAKDPSEAYQKVKDFLDENKIGYVSDRELESIELIAEEVDYPNCKTLLFT